MSESTGELFDRVADALGDEYELVRLLGKGGMASVFLAREHALKRLVAVKVLDPALAGSADFRARFQREAETAAQLQHPNIVPIYGVGQAKGLAYFTMAYVDGESLGARLRSRGQLPVDEALRVTREVAAALGAAHRRGVIHRDIKPQNVLFDTESGRAHVTDFGIAQLVIPDPEQVAGQDTEALTVAGMVMGTPRYMSPEQASGERDLSPASDLYAVGILLYEMVTGAYPYDVGPNRNFLVAHLTQDCIPMTSRVDGIPEELDAMVGRLLSKDPEARFGSTDELLTTLGTGEVSVPVIPARHSRAGWIVAAAAAVILFVTLGRGLLPQRGGVPDGVDPRQSILLGFFTNTSSDRELDWLRIGGVELLGQSLARWEDMRVIGVDRLLDAANKAGVDADRPLSREDALEMARRSGVWTATTGSLIRLNNDSLRITVRVYDVATEDELSTAVVAVHRDSALTDAFDALGRSILAVAGAPAAAILDVEPPTRSIEAYRAYIDGMLARNRFDLDSARIAFRHAVDRDPEFALAYFALSSVSASVQVPAEKPEFLDLADSALRYSATRPPKERLLIEAFHALVNADLVEAQRRYADLVERDSTMVDAWAGLGASATYDLTLRTDADGNEFFPSSPGVALRAFERTLALDANDYRAYPIVTQLLVLASREDGVLPAFRDPPPGDLTTLGRRVPTAWYRVLLVDDSIVTIPRDSVDALYPRAVQDSLGRVARRKAEFFLRQWVTRAPEQGFAWLTLATIQQEEDNFAEALISLAEAERLGIPSVIPFGILRLGFLLEARMLPEARDLADSLALGEWGPDMDDRHVIQSMPTSNALLVAGRIHEAVDLDRRRRALQAQAPGSDEIRARFALAPLMLELRALAAVDLASPELVQQALDSLEVVAARLDDSAAAEFREGGMAAVMNAAAALGDTAMVAAFRVSSERTDYLAVDAWAAVNAGAMEEAHRRYEAALLDSTWVPRSVYPLARTAEALGRSEEALAHYSAMDTLGYTGRATTDTDFLLLVQSYAMRAALFDAAGDNESAKAYYRKFLELWDDPDPELREKRDLARQALGELERQDRRDN
jgi:serine/threonine-protein kinase